MLDKLDGRVPAQDGQQPLPPVQDTNASQVDTYLRREFYSKNIDMCTVFYPGLIRSVIRLVMK